MVIGYILSYKQGLKRKDITLINYYLFGRIVKRVTKTTNQEFYYYPGLFETTPYIRITNGCYFSERIVDDYEGRLIVIQAKDIIFPKEIEFKTARIHWEQHIKKHNLIVRNF